MISFCTWIRNRLHQFRRVVDVNLERMRDFDQWCVLDVGSNDGLYEFIRDRVTDPRVVYRRIPAPEKMHFSKLYNLSHALGRGDILCNLDADNFIGPEFCEWLDFNVGPNRICHAWSTNWEDGTYGRIAMTPEMFKRLGGYDEDLDHVGCQDTDILQRAQKLGASCVTSYKPEVYGGSIPNTIEDTMSFIPGGRAEYLRSNAANHKQMLLNLDSGKVVANKRE